MLTLLHEHELMKRSSANNQQSLMLKISVGNYASTDLEIDQALSIKDEEERKKVKDESIERKRKKLQEILMKIGIETEDVETE